MQIPMHNYVLRVYCTRAGSPARRRLRCGDWLAPHSARSADLSEGRPSYSHLPRSRHQGVCESRIRDRLHRVHDAHHVPSPANIYGIFICRICMQMSMCILHIYCPEQVPVDGQWAAEVRLLQVQRTRPARADAGGGHSYKPTVSCSHLFPQSDSVPYVWMTRCTAAAEVSA